MSVGCFFLFKQKTEYEMRISDWSSGVCSSDLHHAARLWQALIAQCEQGRERAEDRIAVIGTTATVQLVADEVRRPWTIAVSPAGHRRLLVEMAIQQHTVIVEIGRASCRERVCQYV